MATLPLRQLGLPDLVGARQPKPGLLKACLDLFDGHPTPAIWDNRRSHWHPAPSVTKEMAFLAHLVGVARAGSYPFRGTGRCGCKPREHNCIGLGCSYLTLDLDAKHGEGDMLRMTGSVVATAKVMGLKPWPFVSRSGGGVHVHLFFDRLLPTPTAFEAARVIRRTAGAEGRCDIMPSSKHWRGYGTLHALPLNPLDRLRGGGYLLDDRLRLVTDLSATLDGLLDAHGGRSDAEIVEHVSGIPLPGLDRDEEVPALNPYEPMSYRDSILVRMMRKQHPQFRRALAASARAFKGGRSARESYLARQMARQTVSPEGIAAFLRNLPGGKGAKGAKSAVYTVALAEWSGVTQEKIPQLAGMQRTAAGAGPWAFRAAPPRTYLGQPNPWWSAQVQSRLSAARSKIDGVLLAFLIDFWVWGRGAHPCRMFYLGHREAARLLDITVKQARGGYDRLAESYSDVLRITPGVPHATLRMATAFDVVGLSSRDQIVWHEGGWTKAPGNAIIIGEGSSDDHDDWTDSSVSHGHTGLAHRRSAAADGAAYAEDPRRPHAPASTPSRRLGVGRILVPAGRLALHPEGLLLDGCSVAPPLPGREERAERRPPAPALDPHGGSDPGDQAVPGRPAGLCEGDGGWLAEHRDRWGRAGAYTFG